MRFAHIASRAFDRPLLLEPRSGKAFLDALAALIGRSNLDARLTSGRPQPMAFDDDYQAPPPTSSLPFGITRWRDGKDFATVDGVAVLEVDGTLVNKNGTIGPDCGMTGYDGLRTQIMAALSDNDVKAIALSIESPGGEVAGCFDLAEFILAAREVKPIWAIVDGMAASAAYALASACHRVTCSAVGMLGSIGVIVAHANFSKMLEKEGIDVSLIYSGSHKADGNPFEPLPAAVRAALQAEIDTIWDQFADLVGRGRGLAAKAVQDLQAETYLAAGARGLKLCDAVQAPAEALAELIETVS